MAPTARVGIWSLLLTILVAACTDGGDVAPDEPERAAVPDAVAAGERDFVDALAESFEIVGVGPTERVVPRGAVESGFVAVVGPTPDDPRFFEVSFFEFDNPVELAAAVPFVGRAEDVPTQLLPTTGIDFAFVEDGAGLERSRRESLQLLDEGPDPQSTFRGDLGRRRLAVGAARILQPADVDGLLNLAALGAWPADGAAPQGMQVLVDEKLAEGAIVALRSEGEDVEIELREGVPSAWFDYVTWEDPEAASSLPIEAGARVSVQGPSDFGVDGQPTEPTRTAIWTEDERLVIIIHPQMVDGQVAALFNAIRTTSVADLLALGEAMGPLPGSEPGDPDGAQPDNDAAPAPSEATVSMLQDFVETARGHQLGEDVEYEFVDTISSDQAGLLFLSSRLWSLLVALDLTAPDQTRVDANQARIEQLRGVPGTVARQPTSAFTEMVVVHEITHTLDDALNANLTVGSLEPFSPSQALLEGNAHRVAAAYVESLDEGRRADVPEFPAIFPNVGDQRLSPATRDSMEFPYDEGRAFAEAIAAAGGEQAINAALINPPVSTEQILFPDAYLANDEPVPVSPPSPPDGATVVDEGMLGAYLLVLAVQGLGAEEVDGRDAVVGWRGDGYIMYRNATETCLEATIEMDDEAGARRLATALDRPRRSVQSIGVEVQLKTCR